MYTVKNISKDIFHIYSGEKSTSLLSKYDILTADPEESTASDALTASGDSSFILKAGKREVTVNVSQYDAGFSVTVGLSDKERLFGLGDATRDGIMVRGTKHTMDIANITSYGPLNVLLSSDGWGFILNTTFASVFDCDSDGDGYFTAYATGGKADFYLVCGNSLPEILANITTVIGRPCILPKFAYGLTFVENEETNIRSLLWDIRTLRDHNIACDTIGLEPSWMEKFYDFSTEKKWNKNLFPITSWEPENYSGDYSFFYTMRKMGMQLSLWLCDDYDMIYNEEKYVPDDKTVAYNSDAMIKDVHMAKPRRLDKVTKPDEPWFEHLKKFVDNGAAAFKLDGSNQVKAYSDRLWGSKYTDAEAHNVNPVLLVKHMQSEFNAYTDRRLLLYTAAAFLGTQKYAATWAGDTGGGPKTLVSLMNYAMCGHTNTSCDIEVNDINHIHYGFLTPWAQYFCWANWKYPWFMGPEIEAAIVYYSNLRSSLVPYIYTMAHKANATGMPILRPLPLVYDTDRFDGVKNAYMLGDSLYVGAFDMNLTLPDGNWVDYFTGKVYSGDVNYEIPEGRGGALLAKEGSIIATMKPQKYVLEKEHDYVIKVFPGNASEFDLYEDDGFTRDYEKGLFATTKFVADGETEKGFSFTVCARKGSFPGRPDNGHDITKNSIPKINPTAPVRDMTVEITGREIADVKLGGESVAFEAENGTARFTVPASLHESGDIKYDIIYK